MPRSSTPFDSLPDAMLMVLSFLFCWQVLAWIIGLTGTYLLLSRFGRWVEESGNAAGEALYGGLPFFLILLAVAQTK